MRRLGADSVQNPNILNSSGELFLGGVYGQTGIKIMFVSIAILNKITIQKMREKPIRFGNMISFNGTTPFFSGQEPRLPEMPIEILPRNESLSYTFFPT